MRRSNHEYSAPPRMKKFVVLKTGFAGALLGAISLAVNPFSALAAPAPGELLVSRFECGACHQPSAALQNRLLPGPAPRLGEAGARLSPQWIKDFLLQPQSEVPGTTMPDSLQSLPAAERPAAAEALSHYLASRQAPPPPPVTAFNSEAAEFGRNLFHTVGCVACHAPQDLPVGKEDGALAALATLRSNSVPLGNLAKKFTLDDLADFLVDPLKSRPAGRMPSQRLTKVEARSIAFYLLRDLAGTVSSSVKEPGLAFDFYNGNFQKVPDFDRLKPAASGRASRISTASGPQKNQMALRFRGLLSIAQDGDYEFWCNSDDGARVQIDGQTVVDNDGVHPATETQGRIRLKAGDHRFTVGYFDSGGDRELSVSYAGPSFAKREIPTAVLFTDGGRSMRAAGGDPFTLDSAKVALGRQYYTRLNCAACHGLEESTTKARPMSQLTGDARGCLSATPPSTAPTYHFTAEQRRELLAFVPELARLTQPLPAADRVVATMTELNCYACHSRDGQGAPQGLRREYFTAKASVDLGEEGALPPHLSGVGAKLQKPWLEKVLLTGASIRPYMVTRMPEFGADNVRPLMEALLQADAGRRSGPELAVEKTATRNGQRLVGTEGLSCIACHVFAGHASLGVPALDLTTVAERLNSDWFRRYLLDPQTLRPGTRMPPFWPDGVAANKTILNGDKEAQITALWSYLSAGKAAALPPGLIPARHELFAKTEPVIYRNFITGAGPRAIGVGYPEKVDLAFDANDMRLALLWQGPFMDASRHWTGRGEGFEPPLGYAVVNLPSGAPFAFLPSTAEAWPTAVGKSAGYQFRGYTYDAQRRPTFKYKFNQVDVDDFFLPVENPGSTDVSFRRTLKLTAHSPAPFLWYRAAVGDSIENKGKGAFLIDGQLRLTFQNSEPTVRQRNGKYELLVPVGFQKNGAEIIEDISW